MIQVFTDIGVMTDELESDPIEGGHHEGIELNAASELFSVGRIVHVNNARQLIIEVDTQMGELGQQRRRRRKDQIQRGAFHDLITSKREFEVRSEEHTSELQSR